MTNANVLFIILAHENFEGSTFCSAFTDLELAKEEADSLASKSWYDRITVEICEANQSHLDPVRDLTVGTIVYSVACLTWEQKKRLAKAEEAKSRHEELMSQDGIAHDHKLVQRATDVQCVLDDAHVLRRLGYPDENFRKVKQGVIRAFNRAVRRDGKRRATEFVNR